MEILFDRGLHLPTLDLWMDSRRARHGCWVSHGHTDHIAAHKHFLATGPTGDFLTRRHQRSQPQEIPYGEPQVAQGYQVTLFPAGHCLGSAQMLIEMESTGRRIVYTGDLKLRPNPTAEPAPILACDTLIIESTFGHPRYVFPPEEETLDRLANFIGRCFNSGATPVLLAYSLGKAQELLHHLLRLGHAVRYDRNTSEIVHLYQDWGISFSGDHGELSGSALKNTVVLIPPGNSRGPAYQSIPKPRTALLTGWALDEEARYRFHADAAFPLSDHADFSDLVRYVQESGAREVFTVNGLPHLADHLRNLGIPSQHLPVRQAGLPAPAVLSPSQLAMSM